MRLPAHYCLLLPVFMVFCAPMLFAQDCGLRLEVSLSKPSYEADEPVELVISLDNQGRTDRRVLVDSPALSFARGEYKSLLRLTPSGSLRRSSSITQSMDGAITARAVPAGARTTLRVFLQRYLEGLIPGHHEIPWEFETTCVGMNDFNSVGSVSGKGLLRFEIAAAGGSLLKTFEEYVQEIKSVQSDSFRRKEAVEALTVSPSPSVIPYLMQVAALGDPAPAFNALKKFKGNAKARESVLESLRSGKDFGIRYGFEVLTAWRERLTEPELRLLMQTESARAGILLYIGTSGDSSHMEIVEQYINHPDPAVAEAAKNAKMLLLRGKE